MDQGRLDEALAYYQKIIAFADTTDKQKMGVFYTRLGHIYFENKFAQSNNCIYICNQLVALRLFTQMKFHLISFPNG